MARSKYRLKTKSGKKKFNNKSGGSRKWIKTRHRIRKKMLR